MAKTSTNNENKNKRGPKPGSHRKSPYITVSLIELNSIFKPDTKVLVTRDYASFLTKLENRGESEMEVKVTDFAVAAPAV